jgi:broad specificity phosphatase PhoE
MRYLEVRRHTMRMKPGKHLSQEGVSLARRVGDSMGQFDRVVTSTLPRAFETAIAMGYAVDEQIEDLADMDEAAMEDMEEANTFADVAGAFARDGKAARFARKQAKLWRSIAESVPDGGSVLAVSHGFIIEAGAVGCLPGGSHEAWGAICSYCDGVRLSFDGEEFVSAEILRA